MNRSNVRAIIKECLEEVVFEITIGQAKAKSEDMFSSRPRIELSKEEEQAVVDQFKSLPMSKKKEFAWCLKRPCANCEKEFGTPNVGWSHGMCNRHREEAWSAMGRNAPPTTNKGSFDLKRFTPEEQQFAAKLYAVVKNRK